MKTLSLKVREGPVPINKRKVRRDWKKSPWLELGSNYSNCLKNIRLPNLETGVSLPPLRFSELLERIPLRLRAVGDRQAKGMKTRTQDESSINPLTAH